MTANRFNQNKIMSTNRDTKFNYSFNDIIINESNNTVLNIKILIKKKCIHKKQFRV